MSKKLKAIAYSSTENKEFKKHYNAVLFCEENNLSYPKETSEFFKEKLEVYNYDGKKVINIITNGVEHEMKSELSPCGSEVKIKVSDIPKEADIIIVSIV